MSGVLTGVGGAGMCVCVCSAYVALFDSAVCLLPADAAVSLLLPSLDSTFPRTSQSVMSPILVTLVAPHVPVQVHPAVFGPHGAHGHMGILCTEYRHICTNNNTTIMAVRMWCLGLTGVVD